MQWFTQSEATAARRRFYLHLVDATDGLTPEVGESAGQPQVSKNGASFGNTTATLTHVGNGFYYVELTAAELDTLGKVAVRFKSAATAEFQDIAVVALLDVFAASNPATVASGGITTSSFAAGAIDASALASNAITAAKIAANAITATQLATDSITSAQLAAGAIDASVLATDAVTKIADGLLTRNLASVTNPAARSLYWALSKLVNKISIAGSTLTITDTDDSTAVFTQTVTTSPSAEHITALDTA